MSSLRMAVVGLKHGMSHVHTIAGNERAALAALCDADSALLAKAQADVTKLAQAAAVRTFPSFDALLTWGEFDAVVIATPTRFHAPMCLAAMRAGKHVLLEKPLVADLAEGRQLLAAARDCRVVAQVGYEVRSSQLVGRLRDLIRQGRIGDVAFVWWHMFMLHKEQGWRADRHQAGGKLFDCCCHYWDILQLLAGAPLLRVSAFGHEPGKTGPNADAIPTVATVNFEFANGVRGNLSLSEVTPTQEWSTFGVAGTRGIVYGNPWRPDGAGSLDCWVDGGMYHEQISVNGALASRGHLGFAEQFRAFAAAVLDGGPVACTLAEAYDVARIGAAIDRSLATGNTVLMSEIA